MAFRDAAGHDAAEMRQVGFDIERNAMEGHPAAHAHADGRDLVLGHPAGKAARLVRPLDPDADAALAALALDVEILQRGDDPALQAGDEAAHVLAAAVEVEHDIGDPLSRAVIGELPAAPGLMHGKTPIEQVLRLCRGAGGIERRMLDQPDHLIGRSLGDGRDPRFHERHGEGVIGLPLGDRPFDGRRAGQGEQGNGRVRARFGHGLWRKLARRAGEGD